MRSLRRERPQELPPYLPEEVGQSSGMSNRPVSRIVQIPQVQPQEAQARWLFVGLAITLQPETRIPAREARSSGAAIPMLRPASRQDRKRRPQSQLKGSFDRSEERRVGKECRSWWEP